MEDVIWNDVPRARALLHEAGYQFCDESTRNPPDQSWFANQDSARASYAKEELLIDKGVAASTCDDPTQSIDCTLTSDDSFWSSTGARVQNSDEWLMYRLRHPSNVVSAVTVHAYRARFQIGHPIYPPTEISFEIGPSPHSLQAVPGRWEFTVQDMPQTFLLPAFANVGRYVKVILHGKCQRQFEDDLWYTAIRSVGIAGHVVSPSDVLCAKDLIMGIPGSEPLCLTQRGAALGGAYFPAHLFARKQDLPYPPGPSGVSPGSAAAADDAPELQAAKKGALAAAFAALTQAMGFGTAPGMGTPPTPVDHGRKSDSLHASGSLPRLSGRPQSLTGSMAGPSEPPPAPADYGRGTWTPPTSADYGRKPESLHASGSLQRHSRRPERPTGSTAGPSDSPPALLGRVPPARQPALQQGAGMRHSAEASPPAVPEDARQLYKRAGSGAGGGQRAGELYKRAGVGVGGGQRAGDVQEEVGRESEAEFEDAGEEEKMRSEGLKGAGVGRSGDRGTGVGNNKGVQRSLLFEWGEAAEWDDG